MMLHKIVLCSKLYVQKDDYELLIQNFQVQEFIWP